jgi:tetratricopeptide (TPR) repeat protein
MELESQAFNAYIKKDLTTAISLYKKILSIQNDFEHGGAWYQLATCYEEAGQNELAKKAYHNSLEQDSEDYIKLCAYGSFLFQINDTMAAYRIYNKIYNYEITNGMDTSNTLLAINELSRKNNLPGADIC